MLKNHGDPDYPRWLPLTFCQVFCVLAQFSKEMFAFSLPLLMFAIYAFPKDGNRTRSKVLLAAMIVEIALYSSIFIHLYRKDITADFSYTYTIGWHALPIVSHIEVASRALMEGISHLISGQGMTTLRLIARQGLGAAWPIGIYLSFLAVYLFTSLYIVTRKKIYSLAYLFFFIPSLFYLGIPNLNIGSDHYWYFSSLGFCFLFLLGGNLMGSWKPNSNRILKYLFQVG
jgi:hypothetical protein